MMSMEYKKEKKKEISRLVIEENTIYEIDLDCQYRKDCKKNNCKKQDEKKGV